jgi:hypothetical protein
MPRLYKCPPELAGDYPALWVTHPLARWSRHRELLAVAARMRPPFRPRLYWAKEIFLYAGAWMGIFAAVCFGLFSISMNNPDSNAKYILEIIYTPFVHPLFFVMFLVFCFWVTVAAWFWELAPILSPFVSRSRLFGTRLFPMAGLLPVIGNPRSKQMLQDLGMAGLGFRGIAVLLAGRSVFITAGEWRRWNWEWPLMGALLCGMAPSSSLPEALVASAAWFVILRTILPALRVSFCCGLGPMVADSIFEPFPSWKESQQIVVRALRAAWRTFFWPCAAVVACNLYFLRWERLGGWWGGSRFFPLPILWENDVVVFVTLIWAAACLLNRRGIEAFLIAGYPQAPRDIIRQGESAFRAWMARNAELPGSR